MYTMTFTFRWPDGATATAVMRAESPDAELPIEISGDRSRLSEMPATTNTGFFAWLARDIAQSTGAELTETSEGQYDRWAQ